MKKLKKINLHHFCQTKMTNYEQNILRGGDVYCISVCLDAVCACNEVGNGSRNFPTSDTTSSNNSSNSVYQNGVSERIQKA